MLSPFRDSRDVRCHPFPLLPLHATAVATHSCPDDSCCRVRGTCQGYLRAFDRHMNLVLAEAEETFLVLPPRPKEGTQHRRTEHR